MDRQGPKKVLIVSASIGTGHTQAAKGIEEYWKLRDPEAEIVHVDFLSNDTFSMDNLIRGTYIKMIDVFPMMYDLAYRLSQGERKGSAMQTVVAWILKRRMLRLINRIEPDVVIMTHPFPCGAACLLKRQHLIDLPLIGVITDFTVHQLWIYDQVDCYCVAMDKMVDELVRAGIDADKVEVTGIPIRQGFYPGSAAKYTPGAPVSALFMGGGLGLGSMEEALRSLDGSVGIDKFIVVAGRNTALYEALLELKPHMRTPTQVYGFTTHIQELMRDATLLITKPGALTCMEAVASALPMVFVNAIPGQEEANATYLERKGCARWVRDTNELGLEIEALLDDPGLLRHMSEVARNWRVDGASSVVRAIERRFTEEEGTSFSLTYNEKAGNPGM